MLTSHSAIHQIRIAIFCGQQYQTLYFDQEKQHKFFHPIHVRHLSDSLNDRSSVFFDAGLFRSQVFQCTWHKSRSSVLRVSPQLHNLMHHSLLQTERCLEWHRIWLWQVQLGCLWMVWEHLLKETFSINFLSVWHSRQTHPCHAWVLVETQEVVSSKEIGGAGGRVDSFHSELIFSSLSEIVTPCSFQ